MLSSPREGHSQPALTGADFQHAVGGEARALQLLRGVVEERHQQDDLARQVRQRGRVPARLLPSPFTSFICQCSWMPNKALPQTCNKEQFSQSKPRIQAQKGAGGWHCFYYRKSAYLCATVSLIGHHPCKTK